MPFDKWQVYIPTMYEVAPVLAMLAYCILIISLSYRYLPLFPRERELNRVLGPPGGLCAKQPAGSFRNTVGSRFAFVPSCSC